ncbi:MAG: radical SAM protein [Athalassotoga sp.]|uniref:radical SAM protein n=1 Tax=Athalassotoga sp. TaxID=2022597 RepID=UPI003CFD3A8E
MKEIKIVKLRSTVSVSVTGTVCQLNCKHCGRHYLEDMVPINRIDEIPPSTKSILVSGGSKKNGEVPLSEHKEEIESLKKRFRLNFHTGLIQDDISVLKLADAISFDFVGDDDVIKKVYNLNARVEDYVRSLEILMKITDRVYPHITIGLDCGKIGHEYKAIDILSRYELKKVVFLVFIPTPRTVFEKCQPPEIEEIKSVFSYAREKFKCELNLGCMYPKGNLRDQIAEAAVENGFNTLTQISEKMIDSLQKREFNLIFQDECCIF